MKRFWNKVNKDGPIPQHAPELGACWVWMGATDRCGYGLFFTHKINGLSQYKKAHRIAFENFSGHRPINKVLHRCDNPPCIRPSHLFDGTQAENVRDMMTKGRAVYAKGSDIGNSKLLEKDVLLLRKSMPFKYGDVLKFSRLLGVSKQTIMSAARGRTWKHIGGVITDE